MFDPASEPSAATRRRRARPHGGLVRLVGVLVVVIVVALIVASLVSVPYYAVTPGTGLDVASLISVPSNRATHVRGSVLLTDVEVTPLKALGYLYYRYFDANASVEPNADILGFATPQQYAEQGVIDMENARQAAAVNALHSLGYATHAEPNGVIVYQPLPGSPAEKALPVGDVVTAFNGTPTLTSAALNAAVTKARPGERVVLRVHKLVATNAVTSTHPVASSTVSLRLGIVAETRDDVPICVVDGTRGVPVSAHLPCLGVDTTLFEVEQSYATIDAPFPVSISADEIGGPSAGLAFTLGVIQRLDHLSLTGGRRIAATGTMSVDGVVGDVGGVAQKTIAVRRAGGSIFLVPPQEYAVARAHAGPTLRIYKVSTLSQALSVLRGLGGKISLG